MHGDDDLHFPFADGQLAAQIAPEISRRDDAPVRKQASQCFDGVVIGLFVPKRRRIDSAVADIIVGVAGEETVARGIAPRARKSTPVRRDSGRLGPMYVLVLPQS